MIAVNKEWFDNHVTVTRYPVPSEIKNSTVKVILNVSDEYISSCATAANWSAIEYHWMPMSECMGHMGLNSIYGAMMICLDAMERDVSVMIHCHAGANRSQTVADCLHFMITGEHRPAMEISQEVEDMFPYDKDKPKHAIHGKNSLFRNTYDFESEGGRSSKLPSLKKMESFLFEIKKMYDHHIESDRGGQIDQIKITCGIEEIDQT